MPESIPPRPGNGRGDGIGRPDHARLFSTFAERLAGLIVSAGTGPRPRSRTRRPA